LAGFGIREFRVDRRSLRVARTVAGRWCYHGGGRVLWTADRVAAAGMESLLPWIFPPVCVLCGEPVSFLEDVRARPWVRPRTRPPVPAGGASWPLEAVGWRLGTVPMWLPVAFCDACESSVSRGEKGMRHACYRCGWPLPPQVSGQEIAPSLEPPSSPESPEPFDFWPEGQEHWSEGQAEEAESVVCDHPPCPHCLDAEERPAFSGVIPLARYEDAVRGAVVASKYPRHTAVSQELSRRLAARIRHRSDNVTPRWDWVTSVPSRPIRQLRRGGSGTRILAEKVAGELGLPYYQPLRAIRPMAKQALLDDAARRENVRGAFAVRLLWQRSTWLQRRLCGANVLLVDDVMTTGATSDEIARVLVESGAASVWLAVVARAMHRESPSESVS